MKLQFPYLDIPVNIRDSLRNSLDEIDEHKIINGRNYRIIKSTKNIKIVYKINSLLDVFFLTYLQFTEIKIPLNKNELESQFCRIQIKGYIKLLGILSVGLLGLISLGCLFSQPRIGILILAITLILILLHLNIYKSAIRYIGNEVRNDIQAILNYYQNFI